MSGPEQAAVPHTRLVDLPGRGTTRVWECAARTAPGRSC